MIFSKICRPSYSRYLTNFRLTQSAVSASSDAEGVQALQKQDPKSTKNVSGISVVSVENYNPITQISVAVKAGSRYENGQNIGVSHCLRNCAALSSKNRTSFNLVRNIELVGGKLNVTSTHEFIIYTLQCIRDQVDEVLPLLADVVSQQAFKPWEVSDANPRMEVDLAMLNKNPEALLMEALHKVAFRGGLNNSVYSPSFMIGKHDSEMLHDYVQTNFTSQRTVVAGLGISHDHLETNVNKLFDLHSGGKAGTASKFSGGEIRIDANLPYTRAAIVAEGASCSNVKDMLSLGVLQCVLGSGPLAKHSLGESTKLGAAAAKATTRPFSVSSLNVSYSDAGFFGVFISGHPDQMKELVKSVVSQMREVTKKLSEADIKTGKHALKAKILLELENSKDVVEDMAIQTALSGNLRTPEDLSKAIDNLTSADINAVVGKVMKTKPAMAAIGPLHCTPYLDELV